MEASALSAAISGTLKIVGDKLAPLLIKEYSSIMGATKDLQGLHDQVKEINCWLETVGDKSMGSGSSLNWLKQLKDVSYDVHDLVNEFYVEAERHDADGRGGKHSVSKCLCMKPKLFLVQWKTAHKIKAIKKRFSAIVKQRTDFTAIATSLPVVRNVPGINKIIGEMPLLTNVDETLVLGRDQDKRYIICKLVETNDQQKIRTVSVIGLGGSGKTALAKLVYNDASIANNFEVRLWVHVSQEFDVAKLVEKLFESIVGEKSEHRPLQHMSKTITDKLIGKRFLLVLDDVWTEDRIHWEQFMVHLKGGALDSRILLTTRNRSVAEAVESAVLFNLPFLSEADSWQVFEQSFGMAIEDLDSEFFEVGKDIVSRCGGVPLAVKVLAGILRCKKNIGEWKAIRDSNLLHIGDEEHRVSECLKLSYFHMPSHLKQCFTVCSVFPKGHRIDRELLIDQWIAHDMITLVDGVDYLEYSGSLCFTSLVQMSFLQDVDEKDDGRVECSMHDLVHDFARSILDDEISLVVPDQTNSSTKTYRYFSFTEASRTIPPENLFEKARAIFVAAGDDFIFGKALKNASYLRSMTVKYVYTKVVPTPILQITNLRYLSISGLKFETIPEAISGISSLQVLRMNCPSLHELPNSIGKLKMLRTLNLSGCAELMILPDSIGDCHMISSLDFCYCEKLTTLPNSISKNQNLRVLRLGLTKIKRLPPGITTLGNLECLDLWLCHELVELPEGIQNLKKLEILNLDGCNGLKSMPAGIGQLSRLQKLGLFVVGEGENSAKMSELGNIGRIGGELAITDIPYGMHRVHAYKACLAEKKNLQALTLNWKSTDWTRFHAANELAVLDGLKPPSGIKTLEIGRYLGVEYARWMLEQIGGSVQGLHLFPCLTVMRLWQFPNLKHLNGLVELPCLVELEVSDMPSLESISGGPFPSLVKLVMSDLPRLREVWMVTERSLASAGEERTLQLGTCLSHLRIEGCRKLMIKPNLPSSLEHLELERSNGQLLLLPGQGQAASSSSDASFPPSVSFSHLKKLALREMVAPSSSPPPHPGRGWELLQHMTSLESLTVYYCGALDELPESMRSLTSLRSLHINRCSFIHTLPEWLVELRSLQELGINCCDRLKSLPQSMGQLTSLQVLRIGSFQLHQLPEWLGQLSSLRILEISGFPELIGLPQSMSQMTFLEELHIRRCPSLTNLPGWIQGLTALQQLEIYDCPDLARRCERGKGEDWHLVSHIPRLLI
ncbi:hypothetical protein ACP70R_008872 [Stipagrostis hirtigluma subsp. patula]